MRELKSDDYWIKTAEDHLGDRYFAYKILGGEANKAAYEGFTEALNTLGLCWSVDDDYNGRIWKPSDTDKADM
jgi:hypothetical protein